MCTLPSTRAGLKNTVESFLRCGLMEQYKRDRKVGDSYQNSVQKALEDIPCLVVQETRFIDYGKQFMIVRMKCKKRSCMRGGMLLRFRCRMEISQVYIQINGSLARRSKFLRGLAVRSSKINGHPSFLLL